MRSGNKGNGVDGSTLSSFEGGSPTVFIVGIVGIIMALYSLHGIVLLGVILGIIILFFLWIKFVPDESFSLEPERMVRYRFRRAAAVVRLRHIAKITRDWMPYSDDSLCFRDVNGAIISFPVSDDTE